MKGDGLIFIFEESKINFSDLDVSTLMNSVGPKVLLLKRIKDRYNNTITLTYTNEHPYREININGRPMLYTIKFDLGFSHSPENYLDFIFGPQFLKINHSSTVNGGYRFKLLAPVAYLPTDQGGYTNHRGMISEITNILGQKNLINYENYVRSFSPVINPSSNPATFTIDLNNLNRLTSFKNTLGGRRGYTYFGSNNIGVSLGLYNTENRIIRSDSYRGYGRDPFYVNMLSRKVDSSETGIPISKDTLVYNYYDEITHVDLQVPVDTLDYYNTSRSKYNLLPGISGDVTPSQFKINYYKVYPLFDPDDLPVELKDVSGITKLVRETNRINSNGDTVVNIYKYERGILEDSIGFNGSFLINEKKTDFSGKVKTNSYQYEYFSPDATFKTSPQLIKKMTETDPFNNSTITTFKYCIYNFNFPFSIDTESGIYYKIQLQDSIKKYKPTNILTYQKVQTYIPDTLSSDGYRGQILSEKVYDVSNLSNYIETHYKYYKRDTVGKFLYGDLINLPRKEGNLKLITNPNGQIQKFFYHLTESSEKAPLDTNLDFPNYPRFYYRIKYNNGSFKDSTEMIYDRRLPIRIDNYKDTSINLLSRIYKTYIEDGSPTKIIDQNRYLTEIKYEPMHRVNSITLPGDFGTQPDYDSLVISSDSIYTRKEIKSEAWGFFSNDSITFHRGSNAYFSSIICQTGFGMYMDQVRNKQHFAFIKLDNEFPRPYRSIDTALLSFYSLKFEALSGTSQINQNEYRTYVRAVTGVSPIEFNVCDSLPWKGAMSAIDNFQDTISMTSEDNSCNYTLKKVSIKRLFSDLGNRRKIIEGLTINSFYIPEIPEGMNADLYPKFKLQMWCGSTNSNTWASTYAPKVYVYGYLDLSDTLRIPIIKGGTIKYKYNNDSHTTTVFSNRNSSTNEYGQIKYSIDGFGKIKQKDIYTSSTTYNTYRYKFNYMNKPSANFDALLDSTNFSYDGLERLIKTRNADTSSTLNSYFYYNGIITSLDTVSGLVEMQRFTDEEGHYFEKFYDAVGNLRREVKFIFVPSGIEGFTAPLITDYKYDSLYRVTQVRTPNNLDIYYSYDGFGRQSKRDTPDAGLTDFYYDKNNNLIYSQDRKQKTTNSNKFAYRSYDGLNRLTGIGETIMQSTDPNDGIQFQPSTQGEYLTVNVYDTISSAIINSFFTGVSGYSVQLNYTKGNLAATAYRTVKTDTWNFKYYRYDVRGRVIKMWNIIAGFDTLITEYTYNSQDQIITYKHSKDGDEKTFAYTYDYSGRLQKVFQDLEVPPNAPQQTIFSEYEYNENSQVTQQIFHNGLMSNDLSYTNRNWISTVTNSSDILNYTNLYFKNGNVKSQSLTGDYNKSFDNNDDLTFHYTYDKSNRLLTTTTSGKNYEVNNEYDSAGNITMLKRYNGQGSITDDFTYIYYPGTNKLKKVTGTASQYAYDTVGNLIRDDVNQNKYMEYDHRNLLTRLRFKQNIENDSIIFYTFFYYDEAGNRTEKAIYQFLGTTEPPQRPVYSDSPPPTDDLQLYYKEIYSRDVSGREIAIYRYDEILQYPIYGLDMVGYLNQDNLAFYYLKDHLGSVRTVFDSEGNLISSQDYDPWGHIMLGRQFNSEVPAIDEGSKFKFTSKERDVESDYDYFGARYYDSRIGRWGQVEPMFEKYPSISSYVYSLANPLTLFDPNGKDVKAISIDAQQMILNTLPTEIQGNIIFNTEGYIDKTSLNSIQVASDNLEALKQLVNDSRLFEVSVESEFTYTNESGDLLSQEFGPIEIDNTFVNSPFGAQTGETGFAGLTLVPGSSEETFNSPSNSILIVINEALSNRGRTNIFSHEAYGHAFLYSMGKEYSHKVKNINGEFIETNEELSKQIIRSINETEKYRRDK